MKMRFGIMISAAAASFVAFGATNGAARVKIPSGVQQQQMLATKAENLRKAGGLVTKPGKGYVAIVDMQRAVSQADIKASYRYFVQETSIVCKHVVRKGGEPITMQDFKVPDGAAAAIFVVDAKDLPMSLVANEAHWGVVNVRSILQGKPDAALLNERMKKQMTRVMAMTIGGCRQGQFRQSIFEMVSDAQALDALSTDRMSNDIAGGILLNAKAMGVEPFQTVVYRRACQEGWAPAPTNDVQKAIWDKVHALPTNPIKIMPETKPVKE